MVTVQSTNTSRACSLPSVHIMLNSLSQYVAEFSSEVRIKKILMFSVNDLRQKNCTSTSNRKKNIFYHEEAQMQRKISKNSKKRQKDHSKILPFFPVFRPNLSLCKTVGVFVYVWRRIEFHAKLFSEKSPKFDIWDL